MLKKLLFIFFIFLLFSCGNNTKNEIDIKEEQALEKINNYAKLKEIAKGLKNKNICNQTVNTDFYIYTFPEIETNIDFSENVKNLENFKKKLQFLSELDKRKDIYIAFSSELEFFENENCFPNKKIVVLLSKNSKIDFFNNEFQKIKEVGIKFNVGVSSINVRENGLRYQNFMTIGELLEVSENDNIEIISYGVSGENLQNIDNIKKLEYEICDSKLFLEENLNKNVNSILYPGGANNDDILGFAEKCGYRFGIIEKGFENSGTSLIHNNFNLETKIVDSNDLLTLVFNE